MLDLQGVKLKSVAKHFWEPEMLLLPSSPSEIKVLPDHHKHFRETWRPYRKPLTMEDMTEIEKLSEAFQREVFPSFKKVTQKCRKIFLRYFTDFIKSRQTDLKDITREIIREYSQWLLPQRNFQGFYLQPRTVVMMLCIARKFLNWMQEKGLIKEQVLYSPEMYLTEISEVFRKRRENLKRQNINTADEIIFKAYEVHIQQYRQERFNPTIKTLETIKKHLHSTGSRVKELTLSDYEAIREDLFALESIPDRSFAPQSIVKCIRYIMDFESWLYEEGYILKRQLQNWTRPELGKYVLHKLEELKASFLVRERYYNISELMRAYKSKLQKRTENVFIFQQAVKHLNFFLQFLISQGRTIYTATAETLEVYKHYILNYEYRPGCHWKAQTQLFMIRDVRRFYDWLTIKKYCEEHPLKNFIQKEYWNWLKEQIKPDSRPMNQGRWYDVLMDDFLKYEKLKGYASDTRTHHKRGCLFFFKYLSMSGIEDMKEVTRETIRNYLLYLAQYKDRDGEPFSVNNQIKHIAGVKSFCQYMEKYGLLENILSVAIEYPKEERGLPTPGFNNFEARLLIESAKGDTVKSLRDRVFFELLYSSGMRSNELCQLKMNNVDLINGMVRIDVPKGGRQYERVVPIGKTACFWLERYIREIRSGQSKRSPYLFLNNNGRPFRTCTVLNAVKVHLLKSPMKKRRIITHSFRVSCATEMLRKGANVKIVQEQLGHKVITSTEKYLRLVPNDLKKAHEKYHPRG